MRRRDVYGEGRASRVIAVHAAKRASRGAVLWGLVFGGTIAASAASYESSFPTPVARAIMARAIEGNVAFEAMFGIIRHMDTVAGFTAYKTTAFTVVLGAIWGLFVATRLTRGEEDTGRWELFLSGRTTHGRAAVQTATGLGVGVVAMWVPMALLTVAIGQRPTVGFGVGTSLFFVTALVSATAMFMAVGLVVAQLAATRHDANLVGAAVVAGSYLVRMVADSAPSLSFLRWAGPLGWIEELHPLTGSHPLAFVPIVAFTAGCTVAAVRVAARRDLGASALPSRDAPRPRTLLLGGQAGLTIRLTRPAVIGWLVAMGTVGLVFGLVTQAAGTALKGSPTLDLVIRRLGASQAGAAAYLGFVFLIAAGLVAVAVAGQVSAIRNEEANGHLDNLLVRRVARWRWLSIRTMVGIGLVVLGSALVGVMAWFGAASQRAGIAFLELVKAGLNVAPPAVFVLGIGILAFALVPRRAIQATYGIVVWSFFVETIASVFDSNHWLRDTSPLLHIRPAPAAAPNLESAAWLVGLGLVAAAVGVLAFGRRDVAGP